MITCHEDSNEPHFFYFNKHQHQHTHHSHPNEQDEQDHRYYDARQMMFVGEIPKCGHKAPSFEKKRTIQNDLDQYRQQLLQIKKQNENVHHNNNDGDIDNDANIITVNVNFHIFISPSGEGDITDEQIQKQMEVLNKAFAGNITKPRCRCLGLKSLFRFEEPVKTPFQFVVNNTQRIVDEEIFQLETHKSLLKQIDLRRGTCADLNIFTGSYEYLGSASLAYDCPNDGENYKDPGVLDSVVLHYDTLPGGQNDNYSQGRTLVHEVGHWLGLFHTFEGGCDGDALDDGDGVQDTPKEAEPAFGCEAGRNSCPDDQGDDPVHNFMDYSTDCCLYQFTKGQRERMILHAGLYRGLFSEHDDAQTAKWIDT